MYIIEVIYAMCIIDVHITIAFNSFMQTMDPIYPIHPMYIYNMHKTMCAYRIYSSVISTPVFVEYRCFVALTTNLHTLPHHLYISH